MALRIDELHMVTVTYSLDSISDFVEYFIGKRQDYQTLENFCDNMWRMYVYYPDVKNNLSRAVSILTHAINTVYESDKDTTSLLTAMYYDTNTKEMVIKLNFKTAKDVICFKKYMNSCGGVIICKWKE